MIKENIDKILRELPPEVKLVAVSKFHPVETIMEAYSAGQHRFGENRPQEFAGKIKAIHEELGVPRGEFEWHFIGHLQTNKLKLVLPYADMVESIDSLHLLGDVDDWGKKNGKVIPVLLELHIGAEQTKQGHFMSYLKDLFPELTDFRELSIGMSGDWRIAIEYGATIVRIGTAIFGERQY